MGETSTAREKENQYEEEAEQTARKPAEETPIQQKQSKKKKITQREK